MPTKTQGAKHTIDAFPRKNKPLSDSGKSRKGLDFLFQFQKCIAPFIFYT